MPTSLKEMTKVVTAKGEVRYYPRNASVFADVLIALDHAGGFVEDLQTGRASKLLREMCATRKVQQMSSSGFVGLMQKLEAAGWINRTTNGKRTYRIGLNATIPSDASEWLLFEADESKPSNGVIASVSNGVKVEQPPLLLLPTSDTKTAGSHVDRADVDEAPSPLPPEDESEDVGELGMRPGRLAARIEKAIPDLVTAAVETAIQRDRDAQMAAIGYYRGVDPVEFDRMKEQLEADANQVARLQSTIENLNEENIRMQVALDWLSDEEDARLVKTNDGTPATRVSLTVNQLPDQYRGFGRLALDAGWTIRRTRGGHLIWRSPDGGNVFSGSTPSGNGSMTVMKRKLRRRGLAIEGKTGEAADVDRNQQFPTTPTT